MRALTEIHFRALSGSLLGAIALMWLLPFFGIRITAYDLSLDGGWIHFLIYAFAAALCMLAWRYPRPFMMASALFALSVILQVLHDQKLGRHLDLSALCVNLLGIAAGVLLGFNLKVLRSKLTQQIPLNSYRPNDRTSSQ